MTNLMTVEQYAQLRSHLARTTCETLPDLHEIEKLEGKFAVADLVPCSCRNHLHYTIAWLKSNELDVRTNVERLCDIGLDSDFDIVLAYHTPEWYISRITEPFEGSDGFGFDWDEFIDKVLQDSDCPPCPYLEEDEIAMILDRIFQVQAPESIDRQDRAVVNEVLNIWFENLFALRYPKHISIDMMNWIACRANLLKTQEYANTHDISGNYIPEEERDQYRPGFWGGYLEKKNPPREKTLAKEKRLELEFGKSLSDQGIPVQYQVHCKHGIADIVTPDAIYEIKVTLSRGNIYRAASQVLLYRKCINPSAKAVIVGYPHRREPVNTHIATALGIEVIVCEYQPPAE